MENRKATMPVPVCATVSRRTGEIRFETSVDYMDQVRFGRVMNRISRLHEAWMDQQAKEQAGSGTYTGGGSALRE